MPMHFKHNPFIRSPLFANVLIIPLSLSPTFFLSIVSFFFVLFKCTIDLIHEKAELQSRTRLVMQGNLNRVEIK